MRLPWPDGPYVVPEDPARRATLIAVPEPEGELRFDIWLQGERETVFFDV